MSAPIPPLPSRAPSRWGTAAVAAAWLIAIGLGFSTLVKYELTAGPAKAHPSQWPAATGLALDARQPSLVLFAHPRCPCSRATVAELETIATECRGRVAATVYF
ncbi:MAG TPA: hypothetical protein VM029_23595, partial [Opitutaceae bacterium]|nr:hypothetical protein [Opitutaceae bacterium]